MYDYYLILPNIYDIILFLLLTQRGSQKIEARRLRDSFPTTEFAISFFQESHTPFPGLLHEVLNG